MYCRALQALVQTRIFDSVVSPNRRKERTTIVLCTGDGNDQEKNLGTRGFPYMVSCALNAGLRVVMFAWKAGWSRNFQKFFSHELFETYFLDDFVNELCA